MIWLFGMYYLSSLGERRGLGYRRIQLEYKHRGVVILLLALVI